LSFGGPATFTPSAWEWSFRATAMRESDPARAREIFAEGMRAHPDSPSLHYNLACLEALEGNAEAALGELRRALDREPDLARYAREDEDLAGLREDARFR